MRIFSISFLVGCCALWLQTQLISGVVQLGLVILLISLMFATPYCTRIRLLLFGLIGGLAGVLWANWHASYQLQYRLPLTKERNATELIGRVCSVPEFSEHHASFLFCVDESASLSNFNKNESFDPVDSKLGLATKELPRRLLLSWFYPEQSVVQGQRWLLSLKVKPPYSNMIPGTFDFERWAFTSGIDGTGYVHQANLLPSEGGGLSFVGLRSSLIDQLQQVVENSDYSGWHLSLMVGYRSLLSEQQFDMLKQSGTAHLIAISGLHVGLVFLWSYWVLSWFWRRSHRLCLWVPAHSFAMVMALVITTVFSLFAGFELPTQRALIALLILVLSRLFLVKWSSFSLLSLTIMALLVWQPLSVLQEGFWLSLSAISIIYWVAGGQSSRGLLFWVKLQLFLSLGMATLAALLFGSFSLNAVLANLIAIPLVSFVILPLDLLAYISVFLSPKVATLIIQFNDYFIAGLTLWLTLLNEHIEALAVSQYTIMSIGVLLLMGYFWFYFRQRFLALLLVVNSVVIIGFIIVNREPSLISVMDSKTTELNAADINQTTLKVYFLDIGQGLSVVANWQGRWLLYDTGFANDAVNASKSSVLPFLNYLGVEQIDWLIVSHNDADHVGGLSYLLQHISVKQLILGEQFAEQEANCESTVFKDNGVVVQWFSANNASDNLNESEPQRLSSKLAGDFSRTLSKTLTRNFSRNNASCLVKLTANGRSLLLTGDIERVAEMRLLDHNPERLKADVVLMPHHGSKTSSSWSFVAQTGSEYAIASAAYLNRFNHPSDEIRQRYLALGVKTYTTWRSGLITLIIDDSGGLTLAAYRPLHKRFWNHSSISRI